MPNAVETIDEQVQQDTATDDCPWRQAFDEAYDA